MIKAEAIKTQDVRGKELFYIKCSNGEHNYFINVGKKTHDEVKALENVQDRPVVVREIDDQFSESIHTIKADGDVTIAVPLDEGYESDLTEFHNDILLNILRELEEGRFEVFEENGEKE